MDGAGNLYASLVNGDSYAGQIARIAPDGSLQILAGTSTPGFSNGCAAALPGVPQAIRATLGAPSDLAADAAGNLYFAADGRVREITLDGRMHTVAGGPGGTFGGDGGPATSAFLSGPGALALDPDGNLYVADRSNNRVRRIDGGGIIQTVAGSGATAGQDPACIAASGIQLAQPGGLASDPAGNIYIGDTGNNRILKLDTGGSLAGIATGLHAPAALAFGFNNLYIAERDRISYIIPDGNLSTFYGPLTGTLGLAVANSGDVFLAGSFGALDLSAGGQIFSVPTGVPLAAGPAGEIYTAGYGVSRFDPDCTLGSISFPYTFDVQGIAVGPAGDLYISDAAGNRIWRIPPQPQGTAVPLSLGLVVNGATLHGVFQRIQTPFGIGGGLVWITVEGNETPAPGEIVAINGTCLGPLQFSQGLSTNLNGVQVSFNGVAAPILSANPNQLLVQVPYEMPGAGTAALTVQYRSQRAKAPLTPEIASVHIFPVANANYTRGDTVSLLITGAGQTVPPGVTGQVAGNPGPQPAMAVQVTVGGEAAQVLSAAADPGTIGTTRVTFRIPADLNPGKTTILVAVGPSFDTIAAQLN